MKENNGLKSAGEIRTLCPLCEFITQSYTKKTYFLLFLQQIQEENLKIKFSKFMKRYILLPAVLLVYLACMAYFTYPGKNPDGALTYVQYYLTISITLIVIGLLAYFLKKKEDKKTK